MNNITKRHKKEIKKALKQLCFKALVGPAGLEPATPCAESFRQSQVFKVSLKILFFNSGYLMIFLMYLEDFIDLIFLSILIAWS